MRRALAAILAAQDGLAEAVAKAKEVLRLTGPRAYHGRRWPR